MELSTATNQTMCSREIAELTGKRHPDVKRDIINMCKQLELDASKFAHVYADGNNRTQVEYLLDKDMSTCLLTGYNAKARMAVIKRWQELEDNNQLSLPQTYAQALRELADKSERNAELEQKVAEDAPKVEFVEQFVEHGQSKCFRDAAGILSVKQNYFTKMLMAHNIVYKKDGEYRAYSAYSKYFDLKTGSNTYTDKSTGLPATKDYSQLRVNNAGLVYLAKRFGNPDLKAAAEPPIVHPRLAIVGGEV